MNSPKEKLPPFSPEPNRILQTFLFQLPGWWVAFKGIEASLLKSQNPQWFGLYSDKKLLALIGCAVGSFAWITFVGRMENLKFLPEGLTRMIKYPFHFFFFLSLSTSLLLLDDGMTVGEDIAGQVKSSFQWKNGQATAPNFPISPKWEDLSLDESSWHIRPPGASWVALPGLFLGMSLGNSVRLSLFAFAILGGIGWIKLAKKSGLGPEGLFILALTLGLDTGFSTTSFPTANSVLFCFVPWVLLWSVRVGGKIMHQKRQEAKMLGESCLFYLVLGSSAWIKLSGMIVALTIGVIPVLMVVFSPSIRKNGKRVLAHMVAGTLVFLPYLLLEKTNTSYSDASADQTYRDMDFNQQSLLWGDHLNESTRGGLLAWSLAGSPGYALPAKPIAHGARDLSLQFEAVRTKLQEYKINPHAFIAGFVGMMLGLLLILNLRSIWTHLTSPSKIFFTAFLTIPFIGLAILSNLHGFNYCLYHAHTIEYAIALTLPVLIAAFPTFSLKPKASSSFLLALCFALPITTRAERLLYKPFELTGSCPPSNTEKSRGLGGNAFSSAIELIEGDSQADSDVLLFLPEGQMSDLVIRTRLRCLAVHFAGGNLTKYAPLRSSRPITVYCAYSSSLKGNRHFQDALENCFPDKVEAVELPYPNSREVTVWKISLVPHAVN